MAKRRQLHPQEKHSTCAVASIRTCLDVQFDVAISEPELEILGTHAHNPIEQEGSNDGHLHRMVRRASFAKNTSGVPWRLTLYQRGTLAGLARYCDRGYAPLATVVNGGQLHMIVVLDVVRDRVKLFDPAQQRATWMHAARFTAWWTQPDGTTEYAIIRGETPNVPSRYRAPTRARRSTGARAGGPAGAHRARGASPSAEHAHGPDSSTGAGTATPLGDAG